MTRNEAITKIACHLAQLNGDRLILKADNANEDQVVAWCDTLCGNVYALIGINGCGMVEIHDIDGWGRDFQARYFDIIYFVTDYFNHNDGTVVCENFEEV